jgi:hypothetical protein
MEDKIADSEVRVEHGMTSVNSDLEQSFQSGKFIWKVSDEIQSEH